MSLTQKSRSQILLCILALTMLFSSATSPVLAQFQDPVPAQTKDGASEEGPIYIYVDGLKVLGVYGILGPLSKEERAKAVQTRVDTYFSTPDFNPDNFHAIEEEFGTRILYGEDNVMMVPKEEAARLKVSSTTLAGEYIRRLKNAAAQYKEDTQPGKLALGVAGVLGGLFLLIFLFSNLGKVSTALARYIVNMIAKGVAENRFVVKDLLEMITSFLSRSLFFAVIASSLHLYIFTALSFFPWTKVYANDLLDKTLAPLASGLHDVSAYLPNLFVILAIAYLAYGTIVIFRFIFDETAKSRLSLPDFDPDWAEPTYKLVRALTIFLALVVAAPYLPGWESPAFKQMGLFIGLLVSLGSTGAVGHLVAGVVLTYTRAFKVGDRVKIGDHLGDVVARSLFTTRLHTVKNEAVTIHNGQVITSEIINYSANAHTDGLILHTSVTIGYDSPWRQVHDLLISAAKDCEGIESSPEPFINQKDLSDFYVEYELNAYTKQPAKMIQIYSRLHALIQDKFNEAGVEIMSPHYSSLRDGNAPTVCKN